MELTDEEIMAKDIGKLSREEFERFRKLEEIGIQGREEKKAIENSKLTEKEILLLILEKLTSIDSQIDGMYTIQSKDYVRKIDERFRSGYRFNTE